MEILLPVCIVAVIALLAGIGLGVANRYMAVKGDPKAEAIEKELPGANCGACGFSGCKGYAAALSQSPNLRTNLCAVGGEEVAKKISAILGVAPAAVEKKCAQVHCRGSMDCTGKKMEYQGISSCKAAAALYGGGGNCRFGCIGLGDCAAACDFGAIQVCGGVAMVVSVACRACGKCVNACPKQLISLVPAHKAAAVLCSNTDKGAQTKAACTAGCLGCRLCAKVCTEGAISFREGLAVVDRDKCIGCGKCRDACKFGVMLLLGE